MLRYLVLIPIVASVALAQTTQSSLIPEGISSNCTTFLTDLNTDTTITKCTQSIISATQSFSASNNVTQANVTSALNSLCSSVQSNCTSDLVGGKIADFYSACPAELTSNRNTRVLEMYDTLFSMVPFTGAICSKDDGGNYCAIQAKLPPSTSAGTLQVVLSSSGPSSSPNSPNATTFNANDIPFLFLSPSSLSNQECNVCTRNILNAYLNFEAAVPYAPGLGNSPFLSQQPQLYKGIQNTCGGSFLSDAGVVKAAGGLAGGTLGGSSSGAISIRGAAQGLTVVGMGILAVIASSAL